MDIILVAIIGTTIWVGMDANSLGVKSGRLGGGLLDMGVLGWVLACLFLWIVAFPAYLVQRPKYANADFKPSQPRKKTKQKSPIVFLGGFAAGFVLMIIAGMIKTDLEVGFFFYLFVAAMIGAIAYLLIELPVKK